MDMDSGDPERRLPAGQNTHVAESPLSSPAEDISHARQSMPGIPAPGGSGAGEPPVIHSSATIMNTDPTPTSAHPQSSPNSQYPGQQTPQSCINGQQTGPPLLSQTAPAALGNESHHCERSEDVSARTGIVTAPRDRMDNTSACRMTPSYRRPPSGMHTLPPSTDRRPLVSPMMALNQFNPSGAHPSASAMLENEPAGAYSAVV